MSAPEWADRSKDLDPRIYKPKKYILDAQCGNAINGTGSATLIIDNLKFVLDTITYSVKYQKDFWQNGQHMVDWRIQNSKMTEKFTMINCMFGNVYHGHQLPLPLRTLLEKKNTVTFDILNLLPQPLDPTQTRDIFTIQFILSGFEVWSEL
jgi:hypothetical protein